jgi:hypothetical protein
MAKLKQRIPRKGDRVTVRGEKGTYAVYLIDESIHAADLTKMGSDLRLASIPWDSLTFLDKGGCQISRVMAAMGRGAERTA